MNEDRWRARLPETDSARDFLVLLHSPLGGAAELYLIDLDELRELGEEQLPPWLPAELVSGGSGQ